MPHPEVKNKFKDELIDYFMKQAMVVPADENSENNNEDKSKED